MIILIVGWLFFRLIEINKNFFFFFLNTLLHILSNDFQANVPAEWYTCST